MFVFTGMGPQWWAMGRELLGTEPVFRAAAEECDAVFREIASRSILAELLADEPASRMASTEVAQPANLVLQIALTRLLASWGVRPDAVLGHSIGEVAAAHAAGALSLRDALRVAYHRSRLQSRLAGRGAMLAVGLSPHDAAVHLAPYGTRISVAAVNSADSVTLAGDRDALEELAAQLAAGQVFHRFLRVEVPYHSAAMTEIRDELLAAVSDVRPATPVLDVYSTVTGARMITDRHDASYWWHNARDTVRFATALTAAIGDGHRLFLEVGPHPVLAANIRDLLRGSDVTGSTVASLTRGAAELPSLRRAVRALYGAGARIDWATFFGAGSYTAIPKYPWQQDTSWAESDRSARRRVQHDRHPMICEAAAPHRLMADVSIGALPFLEDHVIDDAVLFPAAGHVELALAARHALTGDPQCSIENVHLDTAVALDADTVTHLAVTTATDSPLLSIDRDDQAAVRCARAAVFSAGRARPPVDVAALRRRMTQDVPPDVLYAALARRGLHYGPRFQAVQELHRSDGEVLARLGLPDGVDADGYHLHPVLLDGALHSLIAAADGAAGELLIPVGIDRIEFFGGSPAYSHGHIVDAGERETRGDVTLLDDDGAVVAHLTGFTCRLLPRPPQTQQHLLYTRDWAAVEPEPRAAVSWLVLDDDSAAGAAADLAGRPDPVWLADIRWAAAPDDTPAPVQTGAAAAERLLATVRSLPAGSPDRYFLITAGAEVLAGDRHAPAIDRAVLLGVARTIMSERPDLSMTLVDVDDSVPDTAALLELLSTVGAEQELAVRDRNLFCARLVRAAPDLLRVPDPQLVPAASASAYRLDGRLGFTPCERPAPQGGEVEVEVEFAALGPTADAVVAGFVGRISRTGSDVTAAAVGDRVYCPQPDVPRSHGIVSFSSAVDLPDSLSSPTAVGLGAMLTAYYALMKIGQLGKGETVLIHDATAAVGLAAVELAKWAGADIIATVDSQEQRDYLRALGFDKVSAAHDVAFYDDVMAWTGGRGTDVVLNVFGGELMAKSAACLAPFGRLLHIGESGRELDASPRLGKNLLYASVDVAQLTASRPDYVAALCLEVLALVDEHAVSLPPATLVPASRLDEPRADPIGQLCIAMRDPELILRQQPRREIRSDASYLITGGLGGFGLETATWLADQGARHLALMSRRGASTPEAQRAVQQFATRGITVRVFAADVADGPQVAAVLDEIEATMPPLRGVVHSAAVFDDRPVADLDRGSLDRVLGPKALGAWQLHSLTGGLDFFVLYSSLSSLIGNPGQANYVAANVALDTLAALRRRHGLPASVIQWGAIGETGLVARNSNVARHLGQLGVTPLRIDDALTALGGVIDRGIDSLAVVDADWARLSSMIPPTSGRRRLQLLVADQRTDQPEQRVALQLLDGLTDEDARTLVEAMVVEIVTGELDLADSTLDPARALRDIGVDSLAGLEIAGAIEKALGLRLSAVDLTSGTSIDQITAMVIEQHHPAGQQ